MTTKILFIATVLIAFSAIHASITNSSALILRQEQQPNYSPRAGTNPSGRYTSGGIWISTYSRSTYEGFQGGGPGSGK
ncbi:MAG: hypothetical protein IGS39_03220 [Calothrix sp. C42_A2020_038]|nr:hypothetical protein [Calothrix sp. C42_A2020_038]